MLRMKDFRVSGDRNTMVVLIIEVTHRTDFTLPKQETAARHEDNLFNPKSQTHKTSLNKKSCNYHVKKHSFRGHLNFQIYSEVEIQQKCYTMDLLPSEIILNATGFLNPADRWRFSASCRRFRELIKVPLRIRIVSRSSRSCLKAQFYVSPAHDPVSCLSADDVLKFGTEYLFWTFDYERENRVFLGKHGQKMLYNEQPHFLYTLGLRPRHPNQTWRVLKGGLEGDPVPFETMVGLDVGGKHPRPHRPDSTQRLFLSAHTLTLGALWYVIQDKWSTDEELQLVRCQDFATSDEVIEKELITHAVPDVLDGGYSLYSPESLRQGKASCELFHATVDFRYWIQNGTMYFHAFQTLNFSFGVPILDEDNVVETLPTSPLLILLKKNSSRWWAIKHYMSTAADVAEGREFNLESFMRTAKDHEDHTIVQDKSHDLVYIEVQDAVIEKNFPDFARDNCKTWKFLLCG